MQKAVVFWSGGKDAAWALHRARPPYQIAALITTISSSGGSVPIHNVAKEHIEAQAAALDLPLWTVPLPQPCSNSEYAARLRPIWERARAEAITTAIFGDLFLADIRAWREQLMASTGITPVFPLWSNDTRALAREMLAGGIDASICAVDTNVLSAELIGQSWSESFIRELPSSVDPCGENGEFHTFVWNMPGFSMAVARSCGVTIPTRPR